MNKQISILIKPSSSKCNLKCKYCFYHDVANTRTVKDYGFMSEETVLQLIKRAYEFVGTTNGTVAFAFQGGEPTLNGLDFYKNFVANVNEIKGTSTATYSFQTNGILIDEAWAKFFSEHKFLIGLSLDGTSDIHNYNRIDYDQSPTFQRVLQTAKLFDNTNVDYNILTVVTKTLARKINSVYNFYKKHNFKYLQFIPCIDEFETTTQPYSLSSEQYQQFLIQLFNMWYSDAKNNNRISIRFFDNILGLYFGMEVESCDMRGVCSFQHVIEANGDVFPCDFYVLDDYLVGNIYNNSFEEMHALDISQTFIKESMQPSPKCQKCEYYRLCRGGCKRHRTNSLSDNYKLNKYCDAYYEFFSVTDEKFLELANLMKMGKIK